jgi:hypothetical protein
MLQPIEVALINSEIEKLKHAREHCTDSGVRKLIDRWIEEQKMKLESGND